MNRSYPRKGSYVGCRNPRSGRNCVSCQAERAGQQHIQVSFLRGEDVVVACCLSCTRKEADELLKAHELAKADRSVSTAV